MYQPASSAQESRLTKYKLKDSIYKEPDWLNSGSGEQLKKRTIPTTLIKRRGELAGATNEDTDALNPPALPFQSDVHRKRLAGKISEDQSVPLTDEFQDNPPKISLFDSVKTEDSSSNGLLINNPDFGKLETDPSHYKNVFNRVQRNRVPTESNESGRPDLPFAVTKTETFKDKEKEAEPALHETAVIVYGYSDSQFPSIVSQFLKYGTILEDFNQPRLFYNTKNYPVFIGPQWVKFTYDNSASAVRALRENNQTTASGSTIGVVPYTRSSLEKLLGTSIPDEQDIGCSMSLVKLVSDQKLPDTELSSLFVVDGDSTEERQDGRFRLLDGSKLINVPKPAKKESASVLERGFNFVFGTGQV
ncbi:hypothetical protein OGAPHI_005918 [Ogataea philodendri]|uniref:RRM Nup35-type domain-containing protein n=1 Tax=Ogataea philodendri TaxID=1378263 RepID=A0A9P8NXS9_9ASCO|nr:uncharacterized protein OGAPHI_005918 [Ogataea philodendri]KAH3661740.1 hypothetical protein OGAPHI_005918 [Ogataea philodendri]